MFLADDSICHIKRPCESISSFVCEVVGAHDVIQCCNFGVNEEAS